MIHRVNSFVHRCFKSLNRPLNNVCFTPILFSVKKHITVSVMIFVCLFVFYVPSTARSFRDGTPIYCPLRRTCSSVNTLPTRNRTRVVAWLL